MNEFNSSGGQSNIRLGDYIQRYPDQAGTDSGGACRQQIVWYVTWNGSQLIFDGSAPSTDSSFFFWPGKVRISLALNNSVTVPVYIATTKNTSGSDLCSSGVLNNGSNYNASSNYHSGSYTYIHIDVDTAAGGSQEYTLGVAPTKKFYINTNTQQVKSGVNVSQYVLSLVDTNRLVTRNISYADYAFPSALAGGSEDTKSTSNYTTSSAVQPGILKNGDSITIYATCDALPNARSSGTAVYPYVGWLAPITWTGTGYAQNFTTGTGGYFGWDTWGGSGTNYINGSGAQSNTGTGVANVCRNGPANPTAYYNGLSGVSGITTSWGGSGASLSCTINNNTGTDYAYYTTWYNSNSSTYNNFNMQFQDNSNNTQTTYTLGSNWSSGNTTEKYEQNFYPGTNIGRDNQSGADQGNLALGYYSTGSVNRATVISRFLELLNIAGGPNTSATYPGINLGASTRTYISYASAFEPTTGTLRIKPNNITYQFKAPTGGAAAFENADVTPYYTAGVAIGSTNFTPTITYATAQTTAEQDNAAVKQGKINIKMSQYYGTRNLGTDGG